MYNIKKLGGTVDDDAGGIKMTAPEVQAKEDFYFTSDQGPSRQHNSYKPITQAETEFYIRWMSRGGRVGGDACSWCGRPAIIDDRKKEEGEGGEARAAC